MKQSTTAPKPNRSRIKGANKRDLTQDTLKKYLEYSSDTGLFTWVVNRQSVKIGHTAGSKTLHGYIDIQLCGLRFMGHRLAWLYVHGRWPTADIDHINGVRSDNRICNLREATRSQNLVNIKVHKRNTSGHTGVMWNRKNKKWTAGISTFHLGSFANKEDAVAARRKAFEELYGLEWMRGETPTPPPPRQEVQNEKDLGNFGRGGIVAKITTRQQDAEIAESLGWRVSHDPWWNWRKKDDEPGFYFDPPGDEWCVRRDGRTDIACNEPLPDFSEYQKGNA